MILSTLVSLLSFTLNLSSLSFDIRVSVLRRQRSDLAAGLGRHRARETGNRGRIASPWVPALLAVASNIPPPRAAQDQPRDPSPDPPDESGQPALGCSPNPRRTAKLGIEVSKSHSADTCRGDQCPLPDMAQLPAEPHGRHCRGRHVRCRNGDVPAFLRAGRPRPPKDDHSLRSHPKIPPKSGAHANDRGLSVRRRAALSAARPGRIMRSDLPRSHAGDGNQGGRNCAVDVASYAAGYEVGPADAV